MTEDVIIRVKRRIDPTESIWMDIDEQIRDIVSDAESRLRVMIGAAVPEELAYIVTAVSVKMFNRIGSEGTASHTVEGETMSWSEDPFEEFRDDIEAWRSANSTGRAHVRFI